jgi:integrase
MKFEEDLMKLLMEKGLSDGTIFLYMKILRKLNGDKPLKNLKFLQDPNVIIESIKDYKDTTQRNMLISIVSILKTLKKDDLYKRYYQIMMDRTKIINDKPKNEKTETQKENWMNWDDVMKKYNDLKDNLKFSKKITEEQYNKLLDFVILSLYVLIPPRRNQDYLKMVITNKSTKDLNFNYLDLKKQQFIFNVYKTAKKDGQLIVQIPEELLKVLKIYIKYNPDRPLLKLQQIPFLVNFDGSPFKSINSITRILNGIFKKKIGASMLRHIYLSSKYSNIIKEQEKDSKLMSHNLLTQKDYVKN